MINSGIGVSVEVRLGAGVGNSGARVAVCAGHEVNVAVSGIITGARVAVGAYEAIDIDFGLQPTRINTNPKYELA